MASIATRWDSVKSIGSAVQLVTADFEGTHVQRACVHPVLKVVDGIGKRSAGATSSQENR
jgi:hypothetical protein